MVLALTTEPTRTPFKVQWNQHKPHIYGIRWPKKDNITYRPFFLWRMKNISANYDLNGGKYRISKRFILRILDLPLKYEHELNTFLQSKYNTKTSWPHTVNGTHSM
jgi:hypothetical protein